MIAIITYNTPHRKTQDLVYHLLLNGFTDIHLIVIPFVKRKSFVPVYKHRPSKVVPIDIETFCNRLNIKFTHIAIENIEHFIGQNDFAHVLIGGAGLLPSSLVQKHQLLNVHPGYLPRVRGLDALKWAIYDDEPIGVTAHFVSEKADEGLMICRKEIPVYKEDTFHSLAYRVYEEEIALFSEALIMLDRGFDAFISLEDDRYEAHRRMPNRLEPEMMEKFEVLRSKAPSMHSS